MGDANIPPRDVPPRAADAKHEQRLLQTADEYLLRNYQPARMVLRSGKGCELVDTSGRRYLDFCAGIAVCCLGHAHPELAAAISRQAHQLMQTSNYFYNEANVELAAELCASTGFDRVYFCNSGTEAIEAAIKTCRRHFYSTGQPERHRFIAFDRAFHGRTMGAVSLTGTAKYHEGFAPLLPGVTHVPYGDLSAVEKAASSELAAIFVEPVQGEGGVAPAPPGFLTGLRQLADDYGALLVLDEIQTGMGRTGKLLAGEHAGVQPDAVTLAKGLGGGFPIGALLLRERLAAGMTPGSHGSTFGGNPLASVAALTVLRIMRRDGLIEAAAQRGQYLGERLSELAAKYPRICTGSRGQGLLQALLLRDGIVPRQLLEPIREHGVLLTAAGPHALRFSPPLIVTDEQLREAVERIEPVLADFAG